MALSILKLFLGYAPGVGKTCTMLNEAHRRYRRREDVVIGAIETHGREAVKELLVGLEQIPYKQIHYKGVSFQEVDVDAIIARKPAVVLMDEFAHRNVPGSKNIYRYEDIRQLLDAGIEVLSALNVQHLESIAPIISQLIGVSVQEIVPDETLRMANEVVFVDVTPVALRNRILRGDVLVDSQIHNALHGYYREGNLMLLRELALRKVAEQVDVSLQKHMTSEHVNESWPARERVVVCVDASPAATYLIARGAGNARRFDAELYIAHLEMNNDEETSKKAFRQGIELAKHLGAQVCILHGSDLEHAIREFVLEHHITQVVVGYPSGGLTRQFLFLQKIRHILDALPEIDVHIIKYTRR
jgi:two-component system, OmpR family, sensor histidine kinase KdpD